MSAQPFDPKICVITPCLNGERHIGEAIDSVLMQGYSNTEHVVADGGSTDNTLQILGRYSHLRVLSSPDRGMYDALNKALAVAGGDLIGILNSDDCYADGAFSSVIDAFRDDSLMALAGAAVAFRDGAKESRTVPDTMEPAALDVLYRSTLGNPGINAWFFRASLFAKIGPFDAGYRVAGDREFMLRLALSGLHCARTDKLVYRYRMHPGSMTFGANPAIWETILREHDRMTDGYLRKPDLPRRARELIKRARVRDTLWAAVRSAQQHDLRGLLSYAKAGIRHDPVWPARFAKRAMHSLALKLGFRNAR